MHFKAYTEDKNKKIVAYKDEDEILGYLVFSSEPVERKNFLVSNFIIHEWLWKNSAVLQEYMTFFHSQADQFERIVFETQKEDFFYLLNDPRNHTNRLSGSLFHESHSVGTGMMVRVINPSKAIRDIQGRQFGMDEIVVRFIVVDDFLRATTHVDVSFCQGACKLISGHPEVEITMGIAEYSSFLFGSISFEKLYQYGLVSLSNSTYAERLTALFLEGKHPSNLVTF